MRYILVNLIAVFILAGPLPVQAGKIYIWVDEKGVTNVTNYQSVPESAKILDTISHGVNIKNMPARPATPPPATGPAAPPPGPEARQDSTDSEAKLIDLAEKLEKNKFRRINKEGLPGQAKPAESK